ncbi:glycosyltransferase family 4 protein [Fluoribacter gormanii]|uniref:Glycogen synthase n=1 Tax=Fluoribacter gormanii TaxID=464 RepID=A0A377GN59_9GAMM|nr:glycosyltransferase family 4 protein [Fluoribacter gormanii]KTD04753.1 Glycosyl transferase group 1 [Fluoribacter gormanii]SIR15555.1 Glycosyltransferase involved in cell wall bisynthesis [Fluoribacter gormanii]STO26247.1 Glycogen synthase [Fluoribacter gormanii]
MKIRLLVDSKHIGGVETHVINLCDELTRRNHDCSIIFVCDYPNNVLYTLCEKKNIRYHGCKSYRALFRLLLKEQPDVIHAHGYKANILARLFGIFNKASIVTTFHAGEKPIGRLILYNFLDRWTSFLSKNICINSEIAKHLPSKAKIIPNFVDVPEHPNPLRTTKPFQIYFIGRVSPEKGPIRFCQLAEQTSSDFEWHMVGAGPLLEQCRNKYQAHVQFHGNVLDMEGIWPKVDLLCITSSYEGLPFVLLEAMSRGIPVVSFNVGAVKKVLSNTGFIIECFNLKQMQERISSYFLKTMEERQIMAKKARGRIIKNFSTSIVVSKIEAFYKE